VLITELIDECINYGHIQVFLFIFIWYLKNYFWKNRRVFQMRLNLLWNQML
jgi:hypothetical protein